MFTGLDRLAGNVWFSWRIMKVTKSPSNVLSMRTPSGMKEVAANFKIRRPLPIRKKNKKSGAFPPAFNK